MLERMSAMGLLTIALLLFNDFAPAQTSAELAVQERDACKKNLQTIYTAIEKYQVDHHDLPNWLSDLVPNYVSDPTVLVCPVSRRTGKTEGPGLADPNLPSSYLFEFCPLPLGDAAPATPTRTRREWKRRQMGLVGSKVPIVRCRQHEQALNLAFDGAIYESPMMWESLFTNKVSEAELTPARMFANEAAQSQEGKRPAERTFPPRDPKTPKQLLDLSKFYTSSVNEAWHGGTENFLQGLPTGVQNFAGINFDVRGLIQLSAKTPGGNVWPVDVKDIPVKQKCQRIHFLHSGAWGHSTDEGKQLASYVVHYGLNQMRLEIPIIYGRSLRDWHSWPSEPPAPKELVEAWKGENAITKRAGSHLRLFVTTWTNLVPDIEIESLELVSTVQTAAPFVLAITLE